MELSASIEEADALLLKHMHEHDLVTGEVFRQLYGIEYRKYFDAYNRNKRLPDSVREYCVKFLEGKKKETQK
jgi:hypothetical protein